MITCPNTSPLLVLGRLDRLDLLGAPRDLVVTRDVLDEVGEKQDGVTARVQGLAEQCREVVNPASSSEVDPQHDLGAGERSVLAWALAALRHVGESWS